MNYNAAHLSIETKSRYGPPYGPPSESLVHNQSFNNSGRFIQRAAIFLTFEITQFRQDHHIDLTLRFSDCMFPAKKLGNYSTDY